MVRYGKYERFKYQELIILKSACCTFNILKSKKLHNIYEDIEKMNQKLNHAKN
jgi:hypothetical protein